MKQCPKCGVTNTDNAQFCSSCGALLAVPQPKFCNQCGMPIEEGHAFCPKCGSSIEKTQPLQPPHFKVIPHTSQINDIGDAVRVCLKEKYASFEGRATRSEYWYFALFYFLVMFAVVIISALIGVAVDDGDVAFVLMMVGICILFLGLLVPNIAATVRRLHDIGKSGCWYFISFVPYVGGFILFVFMLLESQPYDNEYGKYIP